MSYTSSHSALVVELPDELYLKYYRQLSQSHPSKHSTMYPTASPYSEHVPSTTLNRGRSPTRRYTSSSFVAKQSVPSASQPFTPRSLMTHSRAIQNPPPPRRRQQQQQYLNPPSASKITANFSNYSPPSYCSSSSYRSQAPTTRTTSTSTRTTTTTTTTRDLSASLNMPPHDYFTSGQSKFVRRPEWAGLTLPLGHDYEEDRSASSTTTTTPRRRALNHASPLPIAATPSAPSATAARNPHARRPSAVDYLYHNHDDNADGYDDDTDDDTDTDTLVPEDSISSAPQPALRHRHGRGPIDFERKKYYYAPSSCCCSSSSLSSSSERADQPRQRGSRAVRWDRGEERYVPLEYGLRPPRRMVVMG